MANRKKNSSMKVRVPGAKQAVENMKYEIASEFGVKLGADASSRENGRVGGEITRRLVDAGKRKSNSKAKTTSRKRSTSSK